MLWKLFAALSVLLLLVMPNFAQEAEQTGVITLERTPCFGSCPVYTLEIHEDGTVLYEGIRFVEVEGSQEFTLDPDTTAALFEGIVESGYFDLDDKYTDFDVTDAPSVNTSVTIGDEYKQIWHYMGDQSAPAELYHIEYWVDVMVGTEQWTGQQPWLPFAYAVLLERTDCFGDCLTYTVALYPDGRAIYTGFRNVDEYGVRTTDIGADTVADLQAQIVEMGFFDWRDTYRHYDVTDMNTVYTTVVSENGGIRRIERYEGDTSAPDDLIVLENTIDDVANTWQWTGFVPSELSGN